MFVDKGSDLSTLNVVYDQSSPEQKELLEKSFKKDGLVLVQQQVQGKYGTYTKGVWKKSSDIKKDNTKQPKQAADDKTDSKSTMKTKDDVKKKFPVKKVDVKDKWGDHMEYHTGYVNYKGEMADIVKVGNGFRINSGGADIGFVSQISPGGKPLATEEEAYDYLYALLSGDKATMDKYTQNTTQPKQKADDSKTDVQKECETLVNNSNLSDANKKALLYGINEKHMVALSKDGEIKTAKDWDEADYAETRGWKVHGSLVNSIKDGRLEKELGEKPDQPYKSETEYTYSGKQSEVDKAIRENPGYIGNNKMKELLNLPKGASDVSFKFTKPINNHDNPNDMGTISVQVSYTWYDDGTPIHTTDSTSFQTDKIITTKTDNTKQAQTATQPSKLQTQPTKAQPTKQDKQPPIKAPSPFTKVSQASKDKVNEIQGKFQSRDAFLDAIKASGLTWKENSNAGINFMRAKMVLSQAIESGADISSLMGGKAAPASNKTAKQPDTKPSQPTKYTPASKRDKVENMANGNVSYRGMEVKVKTVRAPGKVGGTGVNVGKNYVVDDETFSTQKDALAYIDNQTHSKANPAYGMIDGRFVAKRDTSSISSSELSYIRKELDGKTIAEVKEKQQDIKDVMSNLMTQAGRATDKRMHSYLVKEHDTNSKRAKVLDSIIKQFSSSKASKSTILDLSKL